MLSLVEFVIVRAHLCHKIKSIDSRLYRWAVFEQMDSIRLSEEKDALLKRLADTEAENAVSLIGTYKTSDKQIFCQLC